MEAASFLASMASVVSQALVLLFGVLSPPPPRPSILHLVTASDGAAAAILLSRKRKRAPDISGDELAAPAAAILPSPPPPPPRMSVDNFRLSFKMTSATFEWLSGLLDPLLDPAGAGAGISGPTRLAIGLSRLASGDSYPAIAERFGVPEPAARSCARRLCRVLCTNFRFWLTFPSRTDLDLTSDAFCSLGGLPDCCGAVACADLGGIGVQIIADASSKIIGIAAGFPNDFTDSRALKSSALYKDIQEGRLLSSSQYLVGNGSYPILPWLMVPYKDPYSGSYEEDFNALHKLMHRPVSRTIASLKGWGIMQCLSEEGDTKVEVAYIVTCAILHNALLMREDYSAIVHAHDKDSDMLVEWAEMEGTEDVAVMDKALVFRSSLAARAKAVHNMGSLATK